MTKRKPATVTITHEDLWWCILSAVRYAMGRRSYAVSDTCARVLRYRCHLEPGEIAILDREIEEAIRSAMPGTLGDKCDDVEWRDLLYNLRRAT